MEQNLSKLDELKGKNPFKVPDGYIEGLGKQIMATIPEETYKKAKIISLRDRIRPWLYLASIFVGLLIILRIVINPISQETHPQDETSSFFQTLVSEDLLQVILDDDLEYLEFIEDLYLDIEFAEVFDNLAY